MSNAIEILTVCIVLKLSDALEAFKIKSLILLSALIKSKGSLKLLSTGELSSPITIEVSYASKKAIQKVEKAGGKVNLMKVK